jgi:hypothetical protein
MKCYKEGQRRFSYTGGAKVHIQLLVTHSSLFFNIYFFRTVLELMEEIYIYISLCPKVYMLQELYNVF